MDQPSFSADMVLRRTTEGQRVVVSGFGELDEPEMRLLLVSNGYTPLNAFPGHAAHPFDHEHVEDLLRRGLLEAVPRQR